jgi:hypothetical protein
MESLQDKPSIKKLKSEMNIHPKNKKFLKISFEEKEHETQKSSTKWTRSLSFNLPRNFVPQIKPKKTKISPSPMALNIKSNVLSNNINNIINNLNESASLEEENCSFSSSSSIESDDINEKNEVNNFEDCNDLNKELYNTLGSISNLRKSMVKIKSKSNKVKFKEAEEMQNILNLNNCNINGLDDNFELDDSNYQNFEFFRKNSCQNKGITILNFLEKTIKKK